MRDEARVGIADRSVVSLADWMLVLRAEELGAGKRDDCRREFKLSLLPGMRERPADVRLGLERIGVVEACSSSSTMTQFLRSSSFSPLKPVWRLLADGRSGVVSGVGSFGGSRGSGVAKVGTVTPPAE